MNCNFIALLIVLLSIFSLSSQASFNTVRVIDTFSVDTDVLVVVLENDAPPAVTVYDSVDLTPEDILGSERDLILVVTEGSAGAVLSCGVSNGTLNLATATGSIGIVTLQYDGEDNSATINPVGLGGVNLRDNAASHFLITATSDHPTLMTIRVYSGEGLLSESVTVIDGGVAKNDYLIPFSSFSGNADFTNVGALELEISANIAVDAVIYSFATASSKIYLIAPLDLEHYDFDRRCKVSSSEEEHLISEYNEQSDLYQSYEAVQSNSSSSTPPSPSSSSSSSSSHHRSSYSTNLILDSYNFIESTGKWLFIPTSVSSSSELSSLVNEILTTNEENSGCTILFSVTLLLATLFTVL